VYRHESVSVAAQAKAQDGVTLFFAIPLLLGSLLMTARGSLKGRMLVTGTLSYFLYTYASYSFLSMFNSLFLVYVLLLSASFFAFILMLSSFDKELLHTYFSKSLPAKGIVDEKVCSSPPLLPSENNPNPAANAANTEIIIESTTTVFKFFIVSLSPFFKTMISTLNGSL